MRGVAAALAVEIVRPIAAGSRRLVRAVPRAEALRARLSLQQRAINREVLARQQALDRVLREQRGQEFARHRAVQQTIAVFGKGCRIPHRGLDAQPDKPAKQQVVLDSLDQLPLRTGSRRMLAAAKCESATLVGSIAGQSANTAWRTHQTAN